MLQIKIILYNMQSKTQKIQEYIRYQQEKTLQ